MSHLHLKKVAMFAFIIAFGLNCQKASLRPSSVMVQYGLDPQQDLERVGPTNWIPYIYQSDAGCSGFLITPQLVMTAAHCVTDDSGQIIRKTINVVFQVRRLTLTYVGQVHSIHPKYNGDSKLTAERYLLNDFAVIKLIEPVKAQAILDSIPVILTDSEQVKAATRARQQVLFFGYGKSNVTSPERVLSYGSGVPIPKASCFMSTPQRMKIKCRNKEVELFCVAAEGLEARIIPGDSGGPVTQYTNGRHQVLGISVHYTTDSSKMSFFETFDTPSVKAWLAQVLAAP